jgi:hypothetical protein
MKNLSLLVSLVLVGLAAALFSPAKPHQVKAPAVEVPRGGALFGAVDKKMAFVDAGLDNPEIQNDENIQAARKCGFCMG